MKASDWISVEDRLPLEGDCILVAYPPQSYAELGNVCFAIYFSDNQFYRELDGTWLKASPTRRLKNTLTRWNCIQMLITKVLGENYFGYQ